jgi:hypothetical protein
MVTFNFLLAAIVCFVAWRQRRVVLVAAFGHFRNLLCVACVKLLDAVLETQRFGVVAVCFVFTLECADDAVEFCVFAK